MSNKNESTNNLNITNSPNAIVQISQNSPNSNQQLDRSITYEDIQKVTEELKDQLKVLTDQLSKENTTRLIVAVEYLEEIIRDKEIDQAPKHFKRIREILKALPNETISSFLSDQITGLLGL